VNTYPRKRRGTDAGPRINNQIPHAVLRVITDNGENLGTVERDQALLLAKERGLDLIEIAPTANPPVAKIMDYGKFRYIEEKKQRRTSAGSQQSELKEIRLGLNTSAHDMLLKGKKATTFLEHGHRVKIDLVLRGRAKYLKDDFIKTRAERFLVYIDAPYAVSEALRRGIKTKKGRAAAKKGVAPAAGTAQHDRKDEQVIQQAPETDRAEKSAPAQTRPESL
jgi:translation initiation factor IF-3